MINTRRSLAFGLAAALLAPLAVPGPAGAETPDVVAVTKADIWLHGQQQADGGFEVAGFPGFETSDAVLALGAVGEGAWDQAEALAYVQAAQTGGKDALDAIDALIDGEATPGSVASGARAAKVASLVAEPLGLDVHDFDPADDSAEPVDLIARIDQHQVEGGGYDFGAQFNGLLYTAIALAGADQTVPAALVTQIRDAQRSDGSWDYTGTTTAGGEDIDTTALALQALRSSGLTATDPDLAAGVAFLAARQQASGAWQAFGSDDPNSTATATVALSDLHIDTTTSAWRAAAGSPATGTYTSPFAWLRNQQATDGHIASPNDSFGVNTFASTQSMQALGQQWYLRGEALSLADAWSKDLASPLAAPVGGLVPTTGSTAVTNPSIKAQRLATVTAAVTGQKGREAAAADLFEQAFHRTIDPSGRTYWSNKLVALSRPEVLSRLTGSAEFYRKAGGTTPTFVDAVYQSVLGRAADPSGRAYWIGRLTKGRSVESVARSLVASSEYRRHQVNAAFDRLLDRAPTTGERDYWTAKIATTRIEVLLATLAGGAEFYEQTAS